MLAYEKQFKNLQLQESRLARRREREMAELRQLQQERKSKESAALENATRAYLLARSRNQPFDLAALGFEFSKQRFEAHLAGLAPSAKNICCKKLWRMPPPPCKPPRKVWSRAMLCGGLVGRLSHKPMF